MFEYDEDSISEDNKFKVRGLLMDTIAPALYDDFDYRDVEGESPFEEVIEARLQVLTYLIKGLQKEAIQLEQMMLPSGGQQ